MSERVSHWMIRREFTRSPFIQRAASSGRARVTELWNAYPRFSSRIKFHEKNRRIIFRSSFFFFFLFFSSPPSSFFPLNRSFQLSFDIGNPIVYFLLAFVYLFQRIHSAFFRSIPPTRASFQGEEEEEGRRRKILKTFVLESFGKVKSKEGNWLLSSRRDVIRTNKLVEWTVERSRALVIRQSSARWRNNGSVQGRALVQLLPRTASLRLRNEELSKYRRLVFIFPRSSYGETIMIKNFLKTKEFIGSFPILSFFQTNFVSLASREEDWKDSCVKREKKRKKRRKNFSDSNRKKIYKSYLHRQWSKWKATGGNYVSGQGGEALERID